MTTNTVLESYLQFRKALNNLRACETKDLEFGQSQIGVLYHLSKSSATMSELVELTFTDKASMTRTISSLVKSGLVKRKTDASDKRVVRIELTKKGSEKAQIAAKVRMNVGRRLEGALNPQERRTFCSLIEKLTNNLNSV